LKAEGIKPGHLDKVFKQIEKERQTGGASGSGSSSTKDTSKLLGSKENPIDNNDFVRLLHPHFTKSLNEKEPYRWRKVVPTMVLFPKNHEMLPSGEPNPATYVKKTFEGGEGLKTELQTKKGQTFEEAVIKAHGKALLMNVCTPFLEIYPKDQPHCAQIFDIDRTIADVVPETSVEELKEFLKRRCEEAKPFKPYVNSNVDRIAQLMVEYRKVLGRDQAPDQHTQTMPIRWRLAFNKADAHVIAFKLEREHLDHILTSLGRETGWAANEILHRTESYSAAYPFGEGDYVVADIDPATQGFKLQDHSGRPLIRTGNGDAFEMTYNKVDAPGSSPAGSGHGSLVRDLSQPIGTIDNPIAAADFVRVTLPVLQKVQQLANYRFRKVVPTMVLYPPDDEMKEDGAPDPDAMKYQVPDSLKTILHTQEGQSFEEAVVKCHGKALLMNVCTPSLEAYHKKRADCEQIYSLADLNATEVPEPRHTSREAFLGFLRATVSDRPPLKPYGSTDIEKVAEYMLEYRKVLNREAIPWRVAYNKPDAVVVAIQLDRNAIDNILRQLGRKGKVYEGECLYREETYNPQYPVNEGDWLIMDIDPATLHQPNETHKLDREARPLCRTVECKAFESTYNLSRDLPQK